MTRPGTLLPGSPGAPALPAPSAWSRPVRAGPRTFCSFLFRRAPRCRRSGRAQAELRRGPPPRPQARARRGRPRRAPPAPLAAAPRPGTARTPRHRPGRRAPTSGRLARRSRAAGLASCSSTAARGSPASLPEPRTPPIRRRSPGLAPCRPLIGARGRPLGVRHAGRAGAHGRRREHGRDGRRPGAAGRAGGRAGRGQARGAASRLRPGPAARAANQRPGSPGCEHRVGGLESEGKRRSLIGSAFPVEREARRGEAGWVGTPAVALEFVSGALPPGSWRIAEGRAACHARRPPPRRLWVERRG